MSTRVKSNVSKVIESFGRLPTDDKEYVLDVARRQLVEAKREKILKRANNARRALKNGNVKRGAAGDLSRDLERD